MSYRNEIASYAPATYDKVNKIMNYNSWADKFPFNEIKPCVIKNGTRLFYVNPDNFAQKEDGTTFDKTQGDLMIEFPRMYYKAEKVGTKINISMSKNKIDSTYKAVAFTKGDSEYKHLYMSAYIAGNSGTSGNYHFSSISGGLPAKDTIADARTKVTKNNPNCSLITFQSLDFVKLLYILLFKSIDKSIMGIGSLNTPTLKGDMDRMGMFRGGVSQNESDDWVKIFGMEHI